MKTKTAKMKTTEFCKDGTLTNYAICCGCVQKQWNDRGDVRVELSKECWSYIVRPYKDGKIVGIGTMFFKNLTEAKKWAKKQLREL
jgi:hypothetical protein